MVSGINPFNFAYNAYQPQNNAGADSYGFGGNPFSQGVQGVNGVHGTEQTGAAGASAYAPQDDLVSRIGKINGELTPEMKRPGLGEHLDFCA